MTMIVGGQPGGKAGNADVAGNVRARRNFPCEFESFRRLRDIQRDLRPLLLLAVTPINLRPLTQAARCVP